MSDIDKKRIISISDGANAMPVLWSINAKEIKYNNAIVMATAIARRVDKQNLWNGLINMTEKVNAFNIYPIKEKVKTIVFKDTLVQYKPQGNLPGIPDVITERFGEVYINKPKTISIKGTIKESFPIPTAPKLPTTTEPIFADNLSNTILYVELRNPINLGSYTEQDYIDNRAFSIIVTIGTTQTTLYPYAIELTGQNTIQLSFTETIMEESTQRITVLYDAEKGDLQDSFNGGLVNAFQATFNYTEKES